MKCSFFQAAIASILLYGCTTWTLTKRLEKKLDGNYTRMLRAILNKSWRQHPTRHQLYGHLPPITNTIQVTNQTCRTLLEKQGRTHERCTPMDPPYGRAKAGRRARTYIQQLCEDTGCCTEDLPEAMNDREKWRERVRDIRATSTTNQTCRTLLEKQGRTHKTCTLMDPHTWPCKSSYVRIRDVVLKTYLGRWMIGRSGERGSGISVLPARYDDDDVFSSNSSWIYSYIYIYIYIRGGQCVSARVWIWFRVRLCGCTFVYWYYCFKQ